ncbi:MAG: 16S rRNA (guanine(966)-N(2))-methyltransferase RsmD [Vicinamibacterales bacterium]
MRVIAGSLKGRRLASPGWSGLRPTSDRLRETLFNVLAPRVQEARVLDLYAGTGALGIEAASRGARAVVLVERDRRAQALIGQNLEHCGLAASPEALGGAGGGCAIIRATAARALEMLRGPDVAPFDIVLLDPPYDQAPAAALDGVEAVVAPDGLVVLEHATRTPAPERVGRLVKYRDLPSGDSTLSFYAHSG